MEYLGEKFVITLAGDVEFRYNIDKYSFGEVE